MHFEDGHDEVSLQCYIPTARQKLLAKLTAAYLSHDLSEVHRVGRGLYDLGYLDASDGVAERQERVARRWLARIYQEQRDDLMAAF